MIIINENNNNNNKENNNSLSIRTVNKNKNLFLGFLWFTHDFVSKGWNIKALVECFCRLCVFKNKSLLVFFGFTHDFALKRGNIIRHWSVRWVLLSVMFFVCLFGSRPRLQKVHSCASVVFMWVSLIRPKLCLLILLVILWLWIVFLFLLVKWIKYV